MLAVLITLFICSSINLEAMQEGDKKISESEKKFIQMTSRLMYKAELDQIRAESRLAERACNDYQHKLMEQLFEILEANRNNPEPVLVENTQEALVYAPPQSEKIDKIDIEEVD